MLLGVEILYCVDVNNGELLLNIILAKKKSKENFKDQECILFKKWRNFKGQKCNLPHFFLFFSGSLPSPLQCPFFLPILGVFFFWSITNCTAFFLSSSGRCLLHQLAVSSSFGRLEHSNNKRRETERERERSRDRDCSLWARRCRFSGDFRLNSGGKVVAWSLVITNP